MKIAPLGINYSTRKLLAQPLDAKSLGQALIDTSSGVKDALGTLSSAGSRGGTLGEELKRKQIDLGDPRSAGWTILLSANDPQRNERINAIRKLAQHRGLNLANALYYNGETLEEWDTWLEENYNTLTAGSKPYYILILGGPNEIPFYVQTLLATTAAVGRLDFETPEELKTYAEKIVRLETAEQPVVARESIFFAPNHGKLDPTYYSHHHLAKPLAERVEQEQGLGVTRLFAKDARKQDLSDALLKSKAAFVFTASHGLGAPEETLAKQKELNGALCCQDAPSEEDAKWLYRASDVPDKEPFLEGAAFFQFACYGYGTPATSDFAHWDPQLANAFNAQADFVAALPKKLLAHPRGPILFIGHLDVALLQGFEDAENPGTAQDPWHARAEPFYRAVSDLLQVNPAGIAMGTLTQRSNDLNQRLTKTFDNLQRGKLKSNDELQEKLADLFLRRNDAQNYMIFGDPAARLRIPAK